MFSEHYFFPNQSPSQYPAASSTKPCACRNGMDEYIDHYIPCAKSKKTGLAGTAVKAGGTWIKFGTGNVDVDVALEERTRPDGWTSKFVKWYSSPFAISGVVREFGEGAASTLPFSRDMLNDVKLAVIGGSGLYHLEGLTFLQEVNPLTPWGYPSDKIVVAQMENGFKVAFLARHGRGHYLNPTEIPVQANIAALKSIGVQVILAFSAVGSLREEIKPRDFVLPDQIIDRTKGSRASTFFEDGMTVHVPFADPFCKELADIIYAQKAVLENGATFHRNKTLVCMEGPAFSTRAESHMYRSWGCDVINMSAVPEAKLAREAEVAYQMVCMSTDYDCWKKDEEAVSVETVLGNLTGNASNARLLLLGVLGAIKADLESEDGVLAKLYKGSMQHACMTAPAKRKPETIQKLDFLLPGYFTS